ncbi:MAG: hypothetical protein ACREIT_12335, partial [Tepidisphaeraceae bacterium]
CAEAHRIWCAEAHPTSLRMPPMLVHVAYGNARGMLTMTSNQSGRGKAAVTCTPHGRVVHATTD